MELPQVILEVIAIRMNEEVAGQLHSGAISIMDEHQAHIVELEDSLEGVLRMNHQLKKNYVILASNVEQVQMQSVMCHTLLMHYVETHWAPIGHLLTQIGALSSCGLAPPFRCCECHVVDELDIAQGETGPDSPSSVPSLQSVSSSINSVYHTPAFLQSAPGPSPDVTQEDFTIVFQGGSFSSSLATLPPPISGDLGLFGEVVQGGVFEGIVEGIPLSGDKGWCSGCSGCDEVDSFGERH